MNLPVTNVPVCISTNAKILGLKHLCFPDMVMKGIPVDGVSIVHHGMDELLIQQNSNSVGQTTCPI